MYRQGDVHEINISSSIISIYTLIGETNCIITYNIDVT